MKILAMVLALSTTSAFAQRYASLNCAVKNPCQYSKSHDLGYCVGNTTLRINDRGPRGYFSHLVVGKSSGLGGELMRLAADIPVQFANNNTVVTGTIDHGDTYVRLALRPQGFAGVLTLEQDFAFEILCK